jgi:hypothetical protein
VPITKWENLQVREYRTSPPPSPAITCRPPPRAQRRATPNRSKNRKPESRCDSPSLLLLGVNATPRSCRRAHKFSASTCWRGALWGLFTRSSEIKYFFRFALRPVKSIALRFTSRWLPLPLSKITRPLFTLVFDSPLLRQPH